MVANKTTASVIADAIIERLDESYDLVYVDYRDEMSDEQVSALVRCDFETLDESRWEWESDNRYESAKHIITELVNDLAREWELDGGDLNEILSDENEEWDRVRFEIEERDKSDWPKQLARNTGSVLLRLQVIDEDASYSYEELKPRRVLKDVGLRATRANVENMQRTLNECSPEYSILMGYWIAGADVADIYELPNDPETVIEIENPYLYLGNPYAGSGFISPRPFEGTIRVKRGDLRTDRDAFGYAVDEVYGGLHPSSFEAKITQLESEEQ